MRSFLSVNLKKDSPSCYVPTSVISCLFCWKLIDYTGISVSEGHLCAQLNWQRGREKTLSLWQSEMLLAIIKVAGFWLFHQCIQGLWRRPLRMLFLHFCSSAPMRYLCFSAQLVREHVLRVTVNCSWEQICFAHAGQESMKRMNPCNCSISGKKEIFDVYLFAFLLTMKWEDWYNFQVDTVNMMLNSLSRPQIA